MTPDQAITRMKAMTAWDQDPELTSDEITELVSMSRVADVYGLWPIDTGWTPTYNLNIGAAEGWRWKAARVESSADTNLNVVRIQVGDVSKSYGATTVQERQAAYLNKAEMYRKRIAGTISAGAYANYPPLEGY